MTTSIPPAASTPVSGSRASSSRARALLLAVAVAVAVALNAVVAAVSIAAGAPASYAPLQIPVFGAFTVLGIAVGWAGWLFVSRRARHPRRVLTTLVIAVVAASLVPNVVLLMTGFIPGTNPAAVVGLMVMHLVVAAVAVPAYVAASRR